jgi:hypothetical protein
MQQKILVLSDLHCGSSYGLMPPDFLDSEGNIHTQNEGQKYLWSKFIHALDRAQPQGVKKIVINGDVIDGTKFVNKGQMLTLYRLGDQREAAVKALEEVKNRFPDAKWYFVSGTPSHEVTEEVKEVAYLTTGAKQPIVRTLTLSIGEAKIRFHHEVSYRSGFLKAGSIETEIINGLMASMDAGWERVDAEIRSHCHHFLTVQRKTQLGVVTPCFQLQTDFMTKGSPTKGIPDLGCVVLSVDDSLKKFGMCPVAYTEYLYRHPAPEVTYDDDTVVDETPMEVGAA